MFSRVCIIGIGTLGGFIAESLTKIETIEEICIVDFDYIEPRNFKNSIYKPSQLGDFKVDALEEILKTNSEIKVTKLNEKYIEGKTKLPSHLDLILDCRDFTYDRYGEIDARLYITSRYLIIDCRKVVKYETHQEGSYLTLLSKSDLRNAAFQATHLIENKSIIFSFCTR